MSDSPDNFFDPDHLPEGVTLCDPSHLRGEEVQKLWDFWVHRQEDGRVGFMFKGCDERDRRVRKPQKQRNRRIVAEEYGEGDSEPVFPKLPTDSEAESVIGGKDENAEVHGDTGPSRRNGDDDLDPRLFRKMAIAAWKHVKPGERESMEKEYPRASIYGKPVPRGTTKLRTMTCKPKSAQVEVEGDDSDDDSGDDDGEYVDGANGHGNNNVNDNSENDEVDEVDSGENDEVDKVDSGENDEVNDGENDDNDEVDNGGENDSDNAEVQPPAAPVSSMTSNGDIAEVQEVATAMVGRSATDEPPASDATSDTHRSSPAAVAATRAAKLQYLRQLSQERAYQEMVTRVEQILVSVCDLAWF
jgi:hypothetical protein